MHWYENDTPVTITEFNHAGDADGWRVQLTLPEFLERLVLESQKTVQWIPDEKEWKRRKAGIPGLTCCTFNDDHRNSANVQPGWAMVLDYDGTYPLAAAKEYFKDVRAILYTSPSHGVDGKDRYRVILPLSAPLPRAQYVALVLRIFKDADGDPYSKDVAHFWIWPRTNQVAPSELFVTDGEGFIDQRFPNLYTPPPTTETTQDVQPYSHDTVTEADRIYATGVLRRVLERIDKSQPGSRHLSQFATAASLAHYVASGCLKYTPEDLLGYMLEKWGPGENLDNRVKTVREGWEKGLREPKWAPNTDAEAQTDLGNAKLFAKYQDGNLRFVQKRNNWVEWVGTHWEETDDTGVRGRVHAMVEQMRDRAIAAKTEALLQPDEMKREKAMARALMEYAYAEKCQSTAKISAIVTESRSISTLLIKREELDADPFVLNVQNGTVDLRTGILKPHAREDFLTKCSQVEYNPNAKAPRWEQFLVEVCADPDIRGYLKRLVGYCMTGVIKENVFPIFWGQTGGNGKSTFVHVLSKLLGSYYATAPRELLLSKASSSHPTYLTTIDGKRLVVASETNDEDAFDQALVKSLTGGDPITARKMHTDNYTITPTHKIILLTNPKVRIRHADAGLRRRIHLVPWEASYSDQPGVHQRKADPALKDALEAELSGILNWAVEGCLEWQETGLDVPPVIQDATKGYLDEENPLKDFFEKCDFKPDVCWGKTEFYDEYTSGCPANEKPIGKRAFNSAMELKLKTEHGIVKEARALDSRKRVWWGVTMKGRTWNP